MQYTESRVSMQNQYVRSVLFYSEHRLVIQRIQEEGSPAWTGAGCKASGVTDMAVTETSGRDECSDTVIGLSVHSLRIYMCSCEEWIMVPRAVVHTPDTSRAEMGISLLAVTPEAPLPPISSLAYFYQYGGISKSTLPHRNSEGIKSVWSICYTPYVGTAFQMFAFLLLLLLTPHKQLRSHLHLVQTLSQTNLTLKH